MFSVLMSVYQRESPTSLRSALASLRVQTVPVLDVVLVEDGPLPETLRTVLADAERELPLRRVRMAQHVGLAQSLNAGLEHITQPWVMRFDSDDICMPNRVESQTKFAMTSGALVFGSQIEEFGTDAQHPESFRRVPLTHAEIIRFAHTRNPFNHMTVCFERQTVITAGGYPLLDRMEDYALWVRLLASGVRAANSNEVLVRARVGDGMIERRGGLDYVRSEWALQHFMAQQGFKSPLSALSHGLARSAVFLSPVAVRRLVYGRFLRRNRSGSAQQ